MRLTLTEEQRLLEASARDVLAAEYDESGRRASVDHPDGCRPAVWDQFASLGWLALPVPEHLGGLGGTQVDLGLLMHALGRHRVVEPYHAAVVLAGPLLTALGTAEAQRLLEPLIEGGARVVLAHGELGGADPYAGPNCRATPCDGGWALDGFKPLVVGAPGAAAWLVTARDAEGRTGLFHLTPDTPGAVARACRLADGSRAADLRLDGARARRLGSPQDDLLPLIQRVLAQGVVALCWQAHGAMSDALERTASYVSQRVQFGQPLARFQVVQHRLAEMHVCCEEARAACLLASLRIDLKPGDLDTALDAAASAKSKVGRAARVVSQEVVQLHGAMGVCEELPIAATFRTLTAFGQQLGSTAWHAGFLGRRQLAGGAWRASQTLIDPAPAAAGESRSVSTLPCDARSASATA